MPLEPSQTPAASSRSSPDAVRLGGIALLCLGLSFAPGGAVCSSGRMQRTAGELHPAYAKPHFTCETLRPLRAAWHPERATRDEAQQTCCNGQIGCAQFLPSSTALRQPHHWHG